MRRYSGCCRDSGELIFNLWKMKRLLIVYNSRSSRYEEIKEEILEPAQKISGVMIGKYEVQPTDVDKNAKILAKILTDGDTVLAVGGDATAAVAANGIMQAGKQVRLGVLPYGNFNDLAGTLGLRNFREFAQGFMRGEEQKLYPLEIRVDGEFFRYATCYVTIGMTAEAVKIFDQPGLRKKLKTKIGRAVGSYLSLAGWYFRNRRKKDFLPELTVNGEKQTPGTSDYVAVNGRRMARVMRGADSYISPAEFRSGTERTVKFWPLIRLMIRSILMRVPGKETTGDKLEFTEPAKVEIQAEGEYRAFSGVKTIEVKKAKQYLRVISRY